MSKKNQNKNKNKSIKPAPNEDDRVRMKEVEEHEKMADEAGHVYMRFPEDKLYNGVLLYEKDKLCKVPVNMKDRWLKRGGVIVTGDEADMEAAMEREIAASGDMPEGEEPFTHDKSGEVDLSQGDDLAEGDENGDDSL